MVTETDKTDALQVLIAGGGVAALETALALRDLAGSRVRMTVLAPNEQFVYRPTSVGEPFSYGPARRYQLAPIVRDAGAQLLPGTVDWVDHGAQVVHTDDGSALPYDALVLAIGARTAPRYKHVLTIDDQTMEQLLHGVVQDLELGYIESIAFVIPPRMCWPLPLYELALMTAGRAYEMNLEVPITLVTPEDSPLAIFGARASARVAELLAEARVQIVTSAYAEIPEAGHITIHPEDRHLRAQRIIALPALYGPSVHGFPLSSEGFIRIDRFGQVPDCGPLFAAGDATDFAVKHGGIGAQQADVVAESIAKLAGVDIEPEPFHPVLRGVLMTGGQPLYMCAHITGGHGYDSEVSTEPLWSPVGKIAAKYLAPYLEALEAPSPAAA